MNTLTYEEGEVENKRTVEEAFHSSFFLNDMKRFTHVLFIAFIMFDFCLGSVYQEGCIIL